MTAGRRTGLDRAAMWLGVASLASAVFAAISGTFDFVQVRGWGIAVAVVLGGLALVAGWVARPALAALAGAGFLAAAVVQVVLWAAGGNFLRGDGSTVSLWLGLGVGLLVTGLADRIWPDEASWSVRVGRGGAGRLGDQPSDAGQLAGKEKEGWT
jgi:hypothetical protein